MKRIASLLLCCFILLGCIIPVMSAEIGGIRIFLNGKELSFDQPPMIINGRTMVPLRAIFEAMGADVYYLPEDQTIIGVKNESKVFLRIAQDIMLKAYIPIGASLTNLPDSQIEEYAIEGAVPLIVGGRTLVPLRAISDAMGVSVSWNAKTSTVTLTCSNSFLDTKNSDIVFYNTFLKTIKRKPAGRINGPLFMKDAQGSILLDGSHFSHAEAKLCEGSEDEYYIQLTLTEDGAKKLGEATKQLSENLQGDNRLHIMLGDQLLFAPRISERIETQIFDIGGIYTKIEADELVSILRNGNILELKQYFCN